MSQPQKLTLTVMMRVQMKKIFLLGSAPSTTISQALCQQDMKFQKFLTLKMTPTKLIEKRSENGTATETEFNAIVNGQQNEKIS